MSTAQLRERFFATCAPGLEPALHREARELGLSKVERQVGGVYFEGTLHDALRANLWLRTAIRVLMRVARFEARDADMLYAGARQVEWERFVKPDGTLVVDAHTASSELDHSLFIEQRVKDAICDSLREKHGTRPTVAKEDAELGVYAHVFRDRCTLLVDTSGDSLHKRGWRRFQGRAPLAETFAAALVQISSWDQRAPFVDPLCGSGTVLVEAAMIARNMAPGLFRERFGCERWPGHDANLGAKLRKDARAAARPSKGRLLGRDLDAKMLEGARENVAAAGLEGAIDFEQGNALDFIPRKGWGAWIASNPPWGERIGDTRDVARLYRDFGAWMRARCAGFHVALLVPTGAIAHELGLKGAESTRVLNGGIECSILRADL